MQLLDNPRFAIYLMMFSMLLVCMNTCNSCSNAKKVAKLHAKIDSLQSSVNQKPNTRQVEKLVKAEGLRSSKRTLYDWNAVVRTAVRPDDRMNEYDKEIQTLEK